MATSAEIQGMQTILRNAGLYTGPQDGNEDSDAFTAAMAQWQAQQGLTPSGSYDLATAGKLAQFFRGSTPGATPADQKKAIERYGTAFTAYLNHPEIGPLLIRGAQEGWDTNYLRAQIQNTAYWRQTEETQRSWEEMKVSDPMGAQRALEESIAYVKDKTHSMGLTLDPNEERRLAEDRIAFGWQQDEGVFNDLLVGIANSRPQYQNQELVGSIGDLMGQVKQRAASQLLALDDASAYQYALRITTGESSLDAYDVMFRKQAKAMAPWAAQLIDDGVLLSDVFDQHRQRIATQLEIDPEQVDLINDPTWRQVVNYPDPKTGQMRAMTQTESEVLARKQTGYQTTGNANEQGANLTDFLSREWGVRPTGG